MGTLDAFLIIYVIFYQLWNNILGSTFFFFHFQISWASLEAQMVKHLPAIRVARVRTLSWKDPLEK